MKKCIWKDGLLTCCDDLHTDITRSYQSQRKWDSYVKNANTLKCHYCGVRIDCQEPTEIINTSERTVENK